LQDGIHYPLQADIFRNGLHDQTITIIKLEFNPSFTPGTFSIAPETEQHSRLGQGGPSMIVR
jgi:hypothetical protein